MIGELVAVVLMCALISLMFFGGWLSPIPGLPDGIFWMVAKMGLVFSSSRWSRRSPRGTAMTS